VLTTGFLEEHRPGERAVPIHPGQPRAFPAGYVHDVRNTSAAPAISIHAYSPPLAEMNEYELEGSRLVPRDTRSERAKRLGQQRATANRTGASNIDKRVSASRALLRRLSPVEARGAMVESDAILVDIRPESQRAAEGGIPGAVIVERNVLEWRFDPTSSARLPLATDHDLLVIIFCSEGYSSSLAAVALQDLGLWRATDMVGGFHGWLASGLPIASPTGSLTAGRAK
jgi:rhodanese-related sulfurtransferase